MTRPLYRSLPLLLLLGCCLATTPALAQDDAGPSSGGRVEIGGGVIQGRLAFEGMQYPEVGVADVHIVTAIEAAPAGRLGVRYFFDRPFGVDAVLTVGFAKIELPMATGVDLQVPKLRFFPWEFRGHMIYRLGFSDSPTAIGVQLELGTQVTGYQVQENEFARRVDDEAKREGEDCQGSYCSIGKSPLLSTTIVGPSAGVGIHLPLGSALVIDLGGHAVKPFFVREAPQSSGRPGGGLGWSAHLAIELQLTDSLGLALEARHGKVGVEFSDKGDRGMTDRGVTGGSSDDTWSSGGLSLTLAL